MPILVSQRPTLRRILVFATFILLAGEPARAFQHELDHLNGVLIIDHAALDELPAPIREREEPFHDLRQRRAFQRSLS